MRQCRQMNQPKDQRIRFELWRVRKNEPISLLFRTSPGIIRLIVTMSNRVCYEALG